MRCGRTGKNLQAAFPHRIARTGFAGAAEDGMAEEVKWQRCFIIVIAGTNFIEMPGWSI
jgi:hypothetical protein